MSRLCRRCGGQKKVQGIGWIECDCPVCAGMGRVPDYDEPVNQGLAETITESIDSLDVLEGKPANPGEPKRRGRKAK